MPLQTSKRTKIGPQFLCDCPSCPKDKREEVLKRFPDDNLKTLLFKGLGFKLETKYEGYKNETISANESAGRIISEPK